MRIVFIYISKYNIKLRTIHAAYRFMFSNKRHDNKLSASTARASSEKLLAGSKLLISPR